MNHDNKSVYIYNTIVYVIINIMHVDTFMYN